MPRANGLNIVGQQLPTLLDVTCCVRLHTLLHVVAFCWELLHKVLNWSNFCANNSQHSFVPWSPKRNATILDPLTQLFQHCWGLSRALHMVSKVLTRCTAGPKIVGVVASVCTSLPTRTQQLPILLRLFARGLMFPCYCNIWIILTLKTM